jgi:DNA (cytosine-5)-methyltransferase 1
MGYHRAGFEVVGVDIEPQPNYPFEFHGADALTFPLECVDAIHASPPCQVHSSLRSLWPDRKHPDLVAPTRELLQASELPYVIENVMGAPLRDHIVLCGSSFGLNVRRHRLFESNVDVLALPCAHHWQTPRFRTQDKRQVALAAVVGVHGHGGYSGEAAVRSAAMDIDWMTQEELTQAIPPAYTEHIGHYLLNVAGAEL